jgi:hypothetical protein
MMPLNNPTHTILQAKRLVESDRRSEIRLNANGGNSILVVCNPMQEADYIAHIVDLLPANGFSIIDLNTSLVEFVANHKEEVTELYNLLQSATHEIFKAPAEEESADLFKSIIAQIENSLAHNKVPVLIKAGALYGTGIDNIHIMEHEVVMKASLPIIILYPATKDADKVMFLGKRPASKYRCMIVQ